MKNYFFLGMLFSLTFFSCNNGRNINNNSDSSSNKEQKFDTVNAGKIDTLGRTNDTSEQSSSLTKCAVTFGIPSWATGDEWDGRHILFVQVDVYQNDAKPCTGTGEHRNEPIGAGHAIYIPIEFKDAKKKIEYDSISKIDIILVCRFGDQRDDGGGCKFRTEGVLTFSDNKTISTGYDMKAHDLYIVMDPNPGFYSYKFEVVKQNFRDAPTLSKLIN